MKILALSNCRLDPLLGSGRTRLAWADGLTRLGHEVSVVDSEQLLGPAEHQPAGRRLKLTWNAWRWLRDLDLSRYDLIEFYGAEFWLATWRLALSRKGKRPLLVAHTDGLEILMSERLCASGETAANQPWWKRLPAALMGRAGQLAFSRSDGFITACELDRQCLRRLGLGQPERMEVVPIGLEPDYLALPLHVTGRQERIVFVGSWIERKGVRHLAAAMTPLLQARPGLKLDLFGGDPDDMSPLESFPSEVHGQVIVHPRVPVAKIIAALQSAKVFFFPSEYEGFGLGLAEAMACGCAAVTTPTGFGAELRDGTEALVCPFGDAAAMRAAISRLLDNEMLRVHVAEAGWKRAQSLRWDASVRKLEAVYLRWLDWRKHSPAHRLPPEAAAKAGLWHKQQVRQSPAALP